MRKNCYSCLHVELEETYCNDCYYATGILPIKWEPAPWYIPDTNADRIRAMSDEELAEHEVRITQDGMYYECSDGETFAIYEDAIAHEIKWLKQPAE